MMFLYSLKLFGSNWVKALKFFLFYVVVWGLCLALLVPVFFAFKDIVLAFFKDAQLLSAFSGVFQGTVGVGLYSLIATAYDIIVAVFAADVGLAVYGLIVLFFILPFLLNVGKYTFCEMLYSYMTSKTQIGFFSALMRGLKKSLLFALVKTIYNLLLLGLVVGAVYALGLVSDATFVKYLLPLVLFVLLVLVYTFNQLTVLGWIPAIIVFDCNVFSGYRRGIKAVGRHFWTTLGTTTIYFLLFWLLVTVFGIYTMAVLVPLMSVLLCVYNMVVFFFSQGMRFYFNSAHILTPKKLEEVDNINKTAYIL